MSDNRKMTEADYGCSWGSVDLTVGCTVSQIGYFSSLILSTRSVILNLLFELLILELGNKVAIYVIEVPDPLGTRSVPVLVRVSIGDRIEI